MANDPSDESLFLKYRADGDLEAFGQLYDGYGPAVFRFLHRLLRDRPAAEDLAQQVFLRVHESRAAFDPRRSFRTWIFTIARRLAVNWASRARGAASGTDPPDLEDEAPSPEHRAIIRDQARAVEQALSSLSRDDAEVLLLARYEGLSYDQIGEVVGCTSDAAKMRVHRALKRLAGRLPEPRQGSEEAPERCMSVGHEVAEREACDCPPALPCYERRPGRYPHGEDRHGPLRLHWLPNGRRPPG